MSPSIEAAAGVRILGGTGGIYQRRAEEPEERVSSCPRRSQTHPEHPPGHRPVPGGGGSEHGHCGLHHRYLLSLMQVPKEVNRLLLFEPCLNLLASSLAGSNYYVRILSTIDRELLKPNASVALHKHSNALVDVLPPEADSSIMMLTSGERIFLR